MIARRLPCLILCTFALGAVSMLLGCSPRPADQPPPPVPPGFATYEEAMAAVLAGQVELVQKPTSVPEEVIEQKDIEYGNVNGRLLTLDLYSPKTPRPKPVPGLIFIHGGGWKMGDKQDYLFYTCYYARRGYVAATVSYRLSGEAQYPAAVSDIKCAVRWMRANAAEYNIDPNKIAVLGGSAGGHLSMMVGYAADIPELEGNGGHTGVSSRVQAVVNFYGPCDLTVEVARTATECLAFFGKTYDEAPELYVQASPITHLSKDDPPTLIMHGTIDELVPIEQSDRLADKLKGLGIPCTYDRIEGWPHTMDMAAAINERFRFFIDRFLEQQFGKLD